VNRFVTTALWPTGVGLTAWHYMWRTTPFHRREVAGSMEDDGPPDIPDGVRRDGLQLDGDGVGPLFHRHYRARIRDASGSAEDVLKRVASDPNQVAPTEFARFAKVEGSEDGMSVGDEYIVRMPGPWNGPVRVVAVTPTSFRLATLAGHLEAGQIEFRSAAEDGKLVFTIESWARSGDRLSNLLYQNVPLAKEVQLHMWSSFLENVARLAGGRLDGGLDIETRRVDDPGGR
jgi:hypothetical protein